MAGKNNRLKRKVIPYILLAFAILCTLLILLDLIMNLPGKFGYLLNINTVTCCLVI